MSEAHQQKDNNQILNGICDKLIYYKDVFSEIYFNTFYSTILRINNGTIPKTYIGQLSINKSINVENRAKRINGDLYAHIVENTQGEKIMVFNFFSKSEIINLKYFQNRQNPKVLRLLEYNDDFMIFPQDNNKLGIARLKIDNNVYKVDFDKNSNLIIKEYIQNNPEQKPKRPINGMFNNIINKLHKNPNIKNKDIF